MRCVIHTKGQLLPHQTPHQLHSCCHCCHPASIACRTCYKSGEVDEVCGHSPDAHDVNHTQGCSQISRVSTGLEGQVVCWCVRIVWWQQLQEPQHCSRVSRLACSTEECICTTQHSTTQSSAAQHDVAKHDAGWHERVAELLYCCTRLLSMHRRMLQCWYDPWGYQTLGMQHKSQRHAHAAAIAHLEARTAATDCPTPGPTCRPQEWLVLGVPQDIHPASCCSLF